MKYVPFGATKEVLVETLVDVQGSVFSVMVDQVEVAKVAADDFDALLAVERAVVATIERMGKEL